MRWITWGAAGSLVSCRAVQDASTPGVRLPNDFRPVKAVSASTRSALVSRAGRGCRCPIRHGRREHFTGFGFFQQPNFTKRSERRSATDGDVAIQ